MAECVMMEEKRAVLRRRTYFQARLSSRDGIGWAPAIVRNLSDAGALVEAALIPEALEISIAQTGLRVRARAAWRNGALAGLRFEATPKPTARRLDDDPNY